MNYQSKLRYIPNARKRALAPKYKKIIVTMRNDFEFPPPVSIAKMGAVPLPPIVHKNISSRKLRELLPEATVKNTMFEKLTTLLKRRRFAQNPVPEKAKTE